MERLREVAREAARDGYTILVAGCWEDQLRNEDDEFQAGSDYGVFGSTYAGIGLASIVLREIRIHTG
jgi:hypothetical protein